MKDKENVYIEENVNEEANNEEVKESFLEILQKTAKETVVEEEIKTDNTFNVFQYGVQKYERFDEQAKSKGEGYKLNNFPLIEKHLEGLESGLYILAGESNSGKSAMMMNIVKDLARSNDLFIIYFSLDDADSEIIPRIIAMEQEIPISVASKPNRYKKFIKDLEEGEQSQESYIQIDRYKRLLAKRDEGLTKIKNEVDSFLIEDSTVIKNSTDLENYIIKIRRFLTTLKGEEAKIAIAVDALNDLNMDKKIYGNLTKEEKVSEAAKFLKQISVDYDMPVFTSSHLRKLNGNRRPTVDDLRDSNTLLYEGSVVWLVHNDVSKNKGASNIYWEDKNAENNMGAIIELDWAKNKKSSYKGRTLYWFKPYNSKAIEMDEENAKEVEGLIYQE